MKKPTAKLAIRSETIRTLFRIDLVHAAAGVEEAALDSGAKTSCVIRAAASVVQPCQG